MKCIYRGRFDDAMPGNNKPVTGVDLSKALDQVLAGLPVDKDQQSSLGCNIKWKNSAALHYRNDVRWIIS